MNNEKQPGFDSWLESLEKMDFDHKSQAIKDIIIEKGNLDDKSKRYFSDCYDYVFKLYKQNKPLSTNLLHIYLTEIKNYKSLSVKDFTSIVMLLGLCGFQIENIEN